ncbi:Monoamine oxidase N [Colletotrichum scovillei]|nr:Monoamine oxidase N [Colletotrichum scovillei]
MRNRSADLKFSPPLPADKIAASREGSINKCNKIHADIKGPDYKSWTSFGIPGKGVVSSFGDHTTPAGNSHLVAFGPDPTSPEGITLGNPEDVKAAVVHLLPKDLQGSAVIDRIVSHDWNNDEFSKGTWCYLPRNFTTKYLSAFQCPHGIVHFASADWSDGWRGWIDGAVQSGMQIAREVIDSQGRTNSRPVSLSRL